MMIRAEAELALCSQVGCDSAFFVGEEVFVGGHKARIIL